MTVNEVPGAQAADPTVITEPVMLKYEPAPVQVPAETVVLLVVGVVHPDGTVIVMNEDPANVVAAEFVKVKVS